MAVLAVRRRTSPAARATTWPSTASWRRYDRAPNQFPAADARLLTLCSPASPAVCKLPGSVERALSLPSARPCWPVLGSRSNHVWFAAYPLSGLYKNGWISSARINAMLWLHGAHAQSAYVWAATWTASGVESAATRGDNERTPSTCLANKIVGICAVLKAPFSTCGSADHGRYL